MENDVALEISVPKVGLYRHQHCPSCNHLLVAPDESHHVSEFLIRHVWSCEACDTGFTTWVRFRQPQTRCAVAA